MEKHTSEQNKQDFIGSFEAKTHFARLLDEVENGEEFTITKHGRPVAKLSPLKQKKRSAKEIVSQIRATAKQSSLRDMDIKEMINHGRETYEI